MFYSSGGESLFFEIGVVFALAGVLVFPFWLGALL